MYKKLKEKIEKAKKLTEELRSLGFQAEVDEKTGEVTIKSSELNKEENKYA